MDPTTVIIVLALNLISTGGLFHLIGRQMPPRGGLGEFAAGTIVFGSAYAMRLIAGTGLHAAVDVALDALMVLAALLFLGGLRQFVGRLALGARTLGGTLLAYVVVSLAVTQLYGQAGRHLLLNVTLGALYLVLALAARWASRREDAALVVPLRVLQALMTALGLLTVVRGVNIGLNGTDRIYHGLAAQIYYACASLAAVLLGPNLLWMVFVRLNRQLAQLAAHDSLTRLLNRNGLDDAMKHHFGSRSREPVTLLLVDIDHFKTVNDSHGHATGDAVLQTVARVLEHRVRAGDFVARTGGEEFVVGCIGAEPALATALGERLREAVAQSATPLPGGRGAAGCTISIGISHPFDRLEQWGTASVEADQALYRAKQSGRNRVVVAG
jgi:diguanylate cyclase (GGDEF)-like protein